MGYYLKLAMDQHKAMQLVADHGGKIVEPPRNLGEIPRDKALICVVENPTFDAALLCYSEDELFASLHGLNGRQCLYVIMDRTLAHQMAGYRE